MIGLNSQRKAAAKFTGASGGFKLLLREVILTPGNINRANTLGAGFLLVRCIGGGAGGGIMYNTYLVGDGSPGAPEGVGAFLIDKDSTLSGTVGAGGANDAVTTTSGYKSGTATSVTVISSFGGGTVIGDASGALSGNSSGQIAGVLGLSQCVAAGVAAKGGTIGGPGNGPNPQTGTHGYGGKGGGPFGGAGGIPSPSLDMALMAGKAPGGGGAAYKQYQNGPGYAGAGGSGGVILDWWG